MRHAWESALDNSSTNVRASSSVFLAFKYIHGHGVTQDFSEAARWFRAAAEQGDAMAQVHLARMYLDGWGVAQDYTEAYAWISIATAQGYSDADEYRQVLLEKMTPSQLERAAEIARDYQRKFFAP